MSAEDEERVRRTAQLARLKLAPGQTRALAAEFAAILDAFRTLQDVDVEHVAPMTSASAGTAEFTDVLRDDLLQPGLERDEALANAPEPRDGFFGVPRVLGGEGQRADPADGESQG